MTNTNPKLLTESQLTILKDALPEWRHEGHHIERWFEFSSFELAIDFVRQVAEIAEKMDHHPDIDIRYRKVRIALTTHSAGGLTLLDIEAASRFRVLVPDQF